MAKNLNLSPEESYYFKQLFVLADADKDGIIGRNDASFLAKSGLSKITLAKVIKTINLFF